MFFDFKARINDIMEMPWTRLSTPAFVLSTIFALVTAAFAKTGQRWVPILDSANLMFHEAGHPLFGFFFSKLEVYGGSFGQLFFPVVTSFHFWRLRQTASFFACLVWLFQNGWNIARYMADARAQLLPLVGNGDRLHDWNEILSRWDILDHDLRYSGWLSFFSAVGILIAWIVFCQKWQEDRKLNVG